MDGKHIVIQPPPNSGSHYYNYKHTHSIILMAIAGPDYECLYADMGGCQMECLPHADTELPHVFVGDDVDAFTLKLHMMKLYFQNGLSADRRVYNHSSSSRGVYCPAGTVDPESRDGELIYGLWRQDSAAQSLLPLTVPKTGHNATTEAKLVRETFKEYFCNEGAIAWQWEACLQHSFGY
ncbi:hypothetical protein P5673_010882 [Acropora cervicornis]|uniref:Uncharacterized protein n=1 Tax=Acropora cervicornis TaxID=6130 RepID=A0AAD9QQV8_ACRCE|nr:hypothetical protein P5673_010882 [Acropora cervicornis]